MRGCYRLPFYLLLFAGFVSSLGALAYGIHSVQKGESLFSIGKMYGTTSEEIMKLNGITDARKVKIGQKLKVPVMGDAPQDSPPPPIVSKTLPLSIPDRYVVQRGEGYREISRKFGLSETEIREQNYDVELEPGVVLILKSKKEKKEGLRSERPSPSEVGGRSKYLFIGSVKHLIDIPSIQKGRWKYIVIHHSATSSGNASIFDLAHRQRGMENGLAYHFVIGDGIDSKDGEIEVGNRWLKQLQGGHLKSDSLNMIAIGICLVGNFENSRPTRRQQAATIELISYLRQKLGKPFPEFKGHREINPMPTTCPGRNFPLAAFHQIFDGDEE